MPAIRRKNAQDAIASRMSSDMGLLLFPENAAAGIGVNAVVAWVSEQKIVHAIIEAMTTEMPAASIYRQPSLKFF
jgi:hypothetical protein